MTQPISSFKFMHRMNSLSEAVARAYAFELDNEGYRLLILPADDRVRIELINMETGEERSHMMLWKTVDEAIHNPIRDWIDLLGAEPMPYEDGPIDDLRQWEAER